MTHVADDEVAVLIDRGLPDDLIDRTSGLEEELTVGEAEAGGRRTEARHRQIVDVRMVVAVRRAIQPGEVAAPNELQRERGLDALVAQLSAVEDDLREATRWRRRAVEQQVGRASLVGGDLERRASIPRRGVEATLELFDALRLDVRRARDAGDVGADVAADDRRRRAS